MQPRFRDTHLPDEVYAALKQKLAQLVENRDQIAPGLDAESAVVHVLGEVGNVWPVSVLSDPQRAA